MWFVNHDKPVENYFRFFQKHPFWIQGHSLIINIFFESVKNDFHIDVFPHTPEKSWIRLPIKPFHVKNYFSSFALPRAGILATPPGCFQTSNTGPTHLNLFFENIKSTNFLQCFSYRRYALNHENLGCFPLIFAISWFPLYQQEYQWHSWQLSLNNSASEWLAIVTKSMFLATLGYYQVTPNETFKFHFTCEKHVQLKRFYICHFHCTHEMGTFSRIKYLITCEFY